MTRPLGSAGNRPARKQAGVAGCVVLHRALCGDVARRIPHAPAAPAAHVRRARRVLPHRRRAARLPGLAPGGHAHQQPGASGIGLTLGFRIRSQAWREADTHINKCARHAMAPALLRCCSGAAVVCHWLQAYMLSCHDGSAPLRKRRAQGSSQATASSSCFAQGQPTFLCQSRHPACIRLRVPGCSA